MQVQHPIAGHSTLLLGTALYSVWCPGELYKALGMSDLKELCIVATDELGKQEEIKVESTFSGLLA